MLWCSIPVEGGGIAAVGLCLPQLEDFKGASCRPDPVAVGCAGWLAGLPAPPSCGAFGYTTCLAPDCLHGPCLLKSLLPDECS